MSADSGWKGLYRIGGVAILANGVIFIIGVPLLVFLGGLPSSGQAALTLTGGQRLLGQAATTLFALSDLLAIPAILALFVALSGVKKTYAAIASGFVGLFIAMDFGVNVVTFSSLLSLTDKYAAATTDAQRASYVATADVLISVSSSGVYLADLVLAVGILFLGLAMLKGVFGKGTAYLGVLTGVVGIIGSIPVPALGVLFVVEIVLTAIFFLAAGFRLYRMA